MYRSVLFALCASTIAFAVPAAAQDYPLKGGNFWNVAEITIDDGHAGDYADYLAGAYRKNLDFSKSKGWIKNSYILSNANRRAGEPDLYLVTISDHVTTPAKGEAREKELNASLRPPRSIGTSKAELAPNSASLAAACCFKSCCTSDSRSRSGPALNVVLAPDMLQTRVTK